VRERRLYLCTQIYVHMYLNIDLAMEKARKRLEESEERLRCESLDYMYVHTYMYICI